MTLGITTLCHNAECRCTEYRILFIVMLSVVMPSVVMLNVVMLNVLAPLTMILTNDFVTTNTPVKQVSSYVLGKCFQTSLTYTGIAFIPPFMCSTRAGSGPYTQISDQA
jgi:hypothetical protein